MTRRLQAFYMRCAVTVIQFGRAGAPSNCNFNKSHPSRVLEQIYRAYWKIPGIRMANISRSTRYSSLSLKEVVCLCAGPCDDAAWEEFVARVGKPISLTIMRTASLWGEASRSVVEDLVQATYLKLWEDGCRLLRDFSVQHPEGILGYLRKIAANAAHDHFKHGHTQSGGGDNPHVSISDIEPEAGKEIDGSEEKIAFGVFMSEIDDHLKASLTGPDGERDRMIFWLYFRQGMSSKEIASLPTIGLGAKGVGSVIERLKHCVRKQIIGAGLDSAYEEHGTKSKIPQELVMGLYGASEYGPSIR